MGGVMRLLVCGGRGYQDEGFVNAALTKVVAKVQPDEIIVIQGGAGGADALAKKWAEAMSFHCAQIEALWNVWPRAAGPKRNAAMLLLQPTHCVAFPGGKGTADMVSKCQEAGVPVWKPSPVSHD